MTRVGVYFDGFNVYYGGKSQFGAGSPGWKWYSPRLLAQNVIASVIAAPYCTASISGIWGQYSLERLVFCTARISPDRDQQALHDQLSYLNAIRAGGHVDHVEYGHYVSRIKHSPLAIKGENGKPEIFHPKWPVTVQDAQGNRVDDATLMVSYFHNEEKGSDVNVATHLLKDAYEKTIDAAVLFSNDSDLQLPISVVRGLMPIGVVNPFYRESHYSLAGETDRSRGDWHTRLNRSLFAISQMPPSVETFMKPSAW